MAGDLDIHERVVWSQQPTAQAAQAAGTQAAFGIQRLANAPAAAPPSGVQMGTTQKHEHVIHQYGRLGIAATPITASLSRSAQAAVAAPSPAWAPVPSAAAPSDLSDVERLGLEAHRIRESAEYKAEKANRSRAGQPWDMPGCGSASVTAAPNAPQARQAARAPGAGAPAPGGQAPGPTSAFMEGSVAVGIIIVQGPTDDLKFTPDEAAKVVAEVQNGLSFYATTNPAGMISFVYDIQNVTLNKPADHNLQPAQMEPYFRDPAMGALGYSADWNGVVNYVETIRTNFNTRWTYCAFFTKYPVSWFAYASIGGPRLVMDYANDGWGPDNIDRVFAHETGHIFGAPDEYAASNCNCGGAWGRFGAPNGNCETCAQNGGIPCLMKNNDFSVCSFSRLHWGWQPRLVLGDMGYSAGGWRVDRHPRLVLDINNDNRADLVGFGDAGVLVSRAQPNGTYPSPTLVIKDYGYVNGGWRTEKHPRFMADTNGDRLLDIVGFGEAGVLVSRQQANGTFGPQQLLIKDFGYTAGGWRVEKHPRLVVDTNGDGRADIVGFGEAGCMISLAQADGSYAAPRLVIKDYGYTNGGWRVEKHPRFMADTTGSRRLDIVGFGEAGVLVSRQQANGTFGPQQLLIRDFGYTAGGWRVEKHPRFVQDITGDGRADIIGFGEAGVIVSLAQSNGTYSAPQLVLNDFGYTAGGWRVDKHPRFLADTTGDGLPDIVGFGEAGVIVARNLGGGKFAQPALVLKDFGYANGGWRVDKHPRFLADTNADGRADIVGFGEAGVLLALSS